MSAGNKQAILVFIKNPVLGRVKTRLAATTGWQFALKTYHKLLDNTKRVVMEYRQADNFLYYDQFVPCYDEWPEEEFSKNLQTGNSLSKKVDNAFSETFNSDYGKVCWIVPDCPSLKVFHLRTAFSQLDNNDVVLGPTFDGGIYLLGMNKHYPELLNNKEWGKGTLYENICKECDEAGLSYSTMEKQQDLDKEEHLDLLKNLSFNRS